jgi:hypothetical protein
LIGDELVFHPPFGRGLPGGWRESGRKISTYAGQTLDVGQASTRLAEVTRRQFGGPRGRGQSAAGEPFDARAMLNAPVSWCDEGWPPQPRANTERKTVTTQYGQNAIWTKRNTDPTQTPIDAGDQRLPRLIQMRWPGGHFPRGKDQTAACRERGPRTARRRLRARIQ